MSLVRKLLCLFGFHGWGIWVYRTYNCDYYDKEEWEERYCIYCGKKQQHFSKEGQP